MHAYTYPYGRARTSMHTRMPAEGGSGDGEEESCIEGGDEQVNDSNVKPQYPMPNICQAPVDRMSTSCLLRVYRMPHRPNVCEAYVEHMSHACLMRD